ncbi:hypothetical protein [Nostoc sp.]|uniref:hypothetical protein n=1 Tax=Nostoc sp. TaxID=1180 RepID=UPI002FF7182D
MIFSSWLNLRETQFDCVSTTTNIDLSQEILDTLPQSIPQAEKGLRQFCCGKVENAGKFYA